MESVSIGIWAHVGSMDENDNERGMSHFIEHMLFKGTETRSARSIADEMDHLGGYLNAFTDKEYTCFYVKVLDDYVESAFDIIADMCLNSVFDPEEIAREKNVVIEEIKRHEDTPETYVHDRMPELLWKDSRIGYAVIGLADVIKSLTREDMVRYLHDHYNPSNLVISAAGNIEHQQLVDIASKRFAGLAPKDLGRKDQLVNISGGREMVDRQTEQVHFCMGVSGCSQDDDDKYVLAVIDAALGGGMSSRLFQEIREARGLAYSVGSYAAAMKAAGLFAIYGGCSVENLREVMDLIENECAIVGRDSLSADELERAKNQIRAALVLGQESMSNRMSRLAKSELYFGKIVRLDDIIGKIVAISRDDVARLADRLFSASNFAVSAIGRFEDYTDRVLENGLMKGANVVAHKDKSD